ncbi:anthranilate synthase family protein [Haloactinomyces albus]|uniref:anthranilate synthase n=1 Tax=Haloactinomyces albus TaxID=1352928 RepID=A0AAE4CPQ7_9ACTN|nr:anthranilate synthase family protein [Haloactinomyces albus]MDR7301963.1 phenazine biosynthesis protein phzE [Haloactinomyces albus]
MLQPELHGTNHLERILGDDPPAFALLHRPGSSGGDVEVLTGETTTAEAIADLELPPASMPARPGSTDHDLLAFLPYRQVTERGFTCHDDGEPIVALRVDDHGTVPGEELMARLPDEEPELVDAGFDIDDDSYAEVVRRVLEEEIGRGSGSNFVIKRSFTATIPGYTASSALALFRKLLNSELGAYWTFLAHLGTRTFVGASPERHVSLSDRTLTMNPISGTYRYGTEGPSVSGAVRFLADSKESDELSMVVDEELKMMAGICESGGRVAGPYLKEMARLAHTEYHLDGTSSLDVREILRRTLFAPTVTGSPLENAFRVIARHEPGARGYYSGVAALFGRDDRGRRTLDSSILIRTADITPDGELDIGVGATLVRDSEPHSEVAETWAKAAGVLDAIGVAGTPAGSPTRAGTNPALRVPLADHVEVRAALRRRNRTLAPYWFEEPWRRTRTQPNLVGLRAVLVDAEDTFTAMLGDQLRSLGLEVTIRPYHEGPVEIGDYDLAVVGPGPGDPRDAGDTKIATLRKITRGLLAEEVPMLSVCLGHQVLASLLGLELVRREHPNQGVQREIDLFGKMERVGFYNTFAARSDRDLFHVPSIGQTVRATREPGTGEIHSLRGPWFRSVQFHPESLLTYDGPAVLSEMIAATFTRHGANDAHHTLLGKSG